MGGRRRTGDPEEETGDEEEQEEEEEEEEEEDGLAVRGSRVLRVRRPGAERESRASRASEHEPV